MANTKAGGQKTKQTLLKKFGSEKALKEWRKQIGAMGGKKSRGGGFASNSIGADGLTGYERAREAGSRGGKASSRRRSNKTYDEIRRNAVGM